MVGSNGISSLRGSVYRKKYQEESTNVSMVSVSRLAVLPHFGQVAFTNSGTFFKGDSPVPVNFACSGNITGKSFSGTGTMPQSSQYKTGIGAPQNRWRDIPQSRKR